MNFEDQIVIAEKSEEESNSNLSSSQTPNYDGNDSIMEVKNSQDTDKDYVIETSENNNPSNASNDDLDSEREEIIISGENTSSEDNDHDGIESHSKEYSKEYSKEGSKEEEIEECFFGMNFLTNQHPNTETIGPIALEYKTIVCLYFSAYWCPPCKNFTPLLIEYYNRINKLKKVSKGKTTLEKIDEGSEEIHGGVNKNFSRQKTVTQGLNKNIIYKPFEVIYISKDTTNKMFETASSEMPWLSIPFGDNRITEFMSQFKIKSIPSLVVLGNRGELVTLDGRIDLMTKGFDSWIHWTGI